MDPSITAAIISAPVAVVAAVASFAAGRLQARGAHRGPVDAVRRQHQRDAYAALLATSNALWVKNSPARLLTQARIELSGSTGITPMEIHDQAAAIALRTSVDEVFSAMAVVSLEGPEEVVDAANAIFTAIGELQKAWSLARANHSLAVADPEHHNLAKAISQFTAVASLHLNGK